MTRPTEWVESEVEQLRDEIEQHIREKVALAGLVSKERDENERLKARLPEPHVYSMSVFDCPRIRVVRDAQVGCLSLYFGRITVNVYGHDPYQGTPVLVEQTEREASKEALGITVEVEVPIL